MKVLKVNSNSCLMVALENKNGIEIDPLEAMGTFFLQLILAGPESAST